MAANLPTEILLLILDALDESRDRFRLLQVCRDWNRALISKVYSSVKVMIPEVQIVPFAQAIQKNTRLRSTVRELIFPKFYPRTDGAFYYNASLFRGFLESFTDSTEELKSWEELLDAGETFAWLAVVLLSLENLQHLDLHWFSCCIEPTVWAVTKIANITTSSDRPLPLQRLEKLTIRAHSNSYPVYDFSPFFKLPAMRALHLSELTEEPDERSEKYRHFWTTLTLEPGCSPVREIIVNDSNCRHGMAEFIASCANLKRFEYQHRNVAIAEETMMSYRCHPFHAALVTQKHSLQVLRLNDIGIAKWCVGEFFDEVDIQEARRHAWFGSLADFVALRELRMPVRNLLQSTEGQEPNQSLVEILPPSIEYLCLAKTDMIEYTMLETQLRRLLDVRGQQFPNLRKIVLQLFQMEVFPGEEEVRWKQKNWGVPPRAKEAFADIMNICKQEGVEFSFVDDGDYQILVDGKVVHDTDELVTTAETIRRVPKWYIYTEGWTA